jgi:site-specific DNA-methyltransferase (adenine-specific)
MFGFGGVPVFCAYGGKKKDADSGIDGYYYGKPDGKQTESGIVSVEGGENPGVRDVRDLVGVVQRDKAPVGVLITLRDPTGPMKSEAAKGESFETAWGKFQKIQIVTVKELLNGKNLTLPPQDAGGGLKQALKEDTSSKTQKQLL